ncbi:MAG: DUF4115 domain-containing protein, partial [Litorimonas sp.]
VLSLRVTAPSWIGIRDARDRRIVNRVFVTGESWQMELGDPFTAEVRDAGAVEVWIGETMLGPLGPEGEPRSGIDLSQFRSRGRSPG